MPLTWTTSMATGIRQIDLQHQELIDMINELERLLEAGSPQQAVAEVLPRLTTYVLFHFGTEEAMLREAPDGAAYMAHAAEHADQHREFEARVEEVRKQPECRELARFIDYLKHWLVNHIMTTDRELARLLAAAPAGAEQQPD